MEEYYPLKLKRKDLEDVNDDFFDFSLSSPARKIRRLDAELPPIIEEEECEIPIGFEHTLLSDQRPRGGSQCGVRIEVLPSAEDKAIVPFNPSTPHCRPSSFSLSVDPRLVSALKNQAMCSNQSLIPWRLADEEAAENKNSGTGNGCLDVVPWLPSKLPSEAVTEFPSQSDNSEMMDVQEVEEEEMDVEDDDTEQRNAKGMILTEGFRQWQQQHCLFPQPPYSATAPIVWYQ